MAILFRTDAKKVCAVGPQLSLHSALPPGICRESTRSQDTHCDEPQAKFVVQSEQTEGGKTVTHPPETLLERSRIPHELTGARTPIYRHGPVSYTHLRAHETPEHLVCRLLLEKKK